MSFALSTVQQMPVEASLSTERKADRRESAHCCHQTCAEGDLGPVMAERAVATQQATAWIDQGQRDHATRPALVIHCDTTLPAFAMWRRPNVRRRDTGSSDRRERPGLSAGSYRTSSYVGKARPSPRVRVLVRRRALVLAVPPKRRSPAPTRTGTITKRNSSTRSWSSSVRASC